MSDSVNQLIANPASAKPIDWNSVIGAQNALITNQNALRDQRAQQAVGDAYRQALKPDGTIDQPTFNRLVTQNPQAAWQAQKAIQGAGDATGSQANSSTTQQALHLSRLNYMNGLMQPLLQNAEKTGQPITRDQIVKGIQQAANDLGLEPDVVKGVLTNLNSLPPGANLTDWVRGRMAANTAAQEQLQKATPTVTIQDTGEGYHVIDTNPQTAPRGSPGATGSFIRKGTSPEFEQGMVTLHTPSGDHDMTREMARIAIRQNPEYATLNPDIQTGGGGGGAAPFAPGGAYPKQGAAPQQGGATSPATPQQGGGLRPSTTQAQPPPTPDQDYTPTAKRADAAASSSQGPTRWGSSMPPDLAAQREAGAKQANAFEQQGAGVGQEQAQLANIATELQSAGTGVGSQTGAFLRQAAIRAGVAPQDWADKQTAYDALGKALSMRVQQQNAAGGFQPSDSRTHLAEASSPNMALSTAGNQIIVRKLQGTNDALDTMYQAWMNSDARQKNPGSFQQWRQGFTAPVQSGPLAGARYDPTVFAVNRMTPPEARRYLEDLKKASPDDYKQFTKNWDLARKENWVKKLGTAQAPASAPTPPAAPVVPGSTPERSPGQGY